LTSEVNFMTGEPYILTCEGYVLTVDDKFSAVRIMGWRMRYIL